MAYRIESADFFVRETKPARFPSALGKAARADAPPQHVTSPMCHLRLKLRTEDGKEGWGCSADRLSVRWLDKRPGRDTGQKRRELAELLNYAREQYLASPDFETPFDKWLLHHSQILIAGRKANQEDLTSTFVSSLFERAVVDAVCRLAELPVFVLLKRDQLGIELSRIHPELGDTQAADSLPDLPTTEINIRHTVGLFDPLTEEDWPNDNRIDDGLPETLTEYIEQQGIRYFKVKISGDAESDMRRLTRLWEILPHTKQPEITLDANEAFEDLEQFANFVKRLEREQLGLFQHIAFIEQPLPRRLALAKRAEKWIRQVTEMKPIVIDESDGTLDSCKRAMQIGYSGTSHKNCKGFFKSIANRALLNQTAMDEQKLVIMSGEDLQNLPIVPLHQDFVSVGMLGINHCERNGHHYNFGLSMLPDSEKAEVARDHPELYEQKGDEWFLKIREGKVSCESLHCPGFGVNQEPDWSSMQSLAQWLEMRHPA